MEYQSHAALSSDAQYVGHMPLGTSSATARGRPVMVFNVGEARFDHMSRM
jgi:hypothetical protein